MRSLLKQLAFTLALVLVLPAWISFLLKRAVLGADRALMSSTQTLSLVPGLLGHFVRRAFLWLVLDDCATSVTVEFGTTFSKTDARLGEHVYIGPYCSLGSVVLERDVLLAPSVHIPSGPDTHGTANPDIPIREQPGRLRTVHIGAGTWIGTGAIVLDDVGANSVIAAGAVVTAPVPGHVVAGGVPARVLKERRR
ncbi:MAG: acyltransferase [Vicinamibacterales bacterium]